jgi:hypothetical protein
MIDRKLISRNGETGEWSINDAGRAAIGLPPAVIDDCFETNDRNAPFDTIVYDNPALTATELCPRCSGKGTEPCWKCESGYVTNSWGDQVMCDCGSDFRRDCNNCKGTGELEAINAIVPHSDTIRINSQTGAINMALSSPAVSLLPALCPLSPSDYDYRAEWDTSEYLPVDMAYHLTPAQQQAALDFARCFRLVAANKRVMLRRAELAAEQSRAEAEQLRIVEEYETYLQADPDPRRTAWLKRSSGSTVNLCLHPATPANGFGKVKPAAIADRNDGADDTCATSLTGTITVNAIKYKDAEQTKRILTVVKSGPAFDKPAYDFENYRNVSQPAKKFRAAGRTAYSR